MERKINNINEVIENKSIINSVLDLRFLMGLKSNPEVMPDLSILKAEYESFFGLNSFSDNLSQMILNSLSCYEDISSLINDKKASKYEYNNQDMTTSELISYQKRILNLATELKFLQGKEYSLKNPVKSTNDIETRCRRNSSHFVKSACDSSLSLQMLSNKLLEKLEKNVYRDINLGENLSK